ncbi:MAG: T9SS type A sorting domain-containing protein [Flavobacteriales bacterium]
MIRHYAFILTALQSALLCAQPTITNTSSPMAGDDLLLHSGPALAAGSPGANQTWNFASATFTNGSAHSIFYGPVSGSPAGTTSTESISGYTFHYRTSATAFELMGMDGNQLDLDCSNPMAQLVFPMTMGTATTDQYLCQGSQLGYVLTRTGSSQFNAVGYGTLVLPYGTVTNVLMVTVHQTMLDDFADNTITDISYTTDLTMYLKPGVPGALLNLASTSNSLSTVVNENSRLLDQSAVGVQEALRNAIGVDVFPNPATDRVEVLFSTNGDRITMEVIDMAGRTVLAIRPATQGAGVQRETLDLTTLVNGVYTLRVQDATGAMGVKRLVVQR